MIIAPGVLAVLPYCKEDPVAVNVSFADPV